MAHSHSKRPVPRAAVSSTVGTHPQERLAKSAIAPDEMEHTPFRSRFAWLGEQASWLVSMATHIALVMVLAMIWLEQDERSHATSLVAAKQVEDEPIDSDEIVKLEPQKPIEPIHYPIPPIIPKKIVELPAGGAAVPEPSPQVQEPLGNEPTDLWSPVGPRLDGGPVGPVGPGPDGRRHRRAFPDGIGRPTKESEDAVELALRWLVNHQLPDGSWCFDHRQGACQGRCGGQGTHREARRGATALAILPFLGAGYTHRQGKHTKTVHDGLRYLIATMRPGRGARSGSWHEKQGTNYSHGIVTLALCEAYAMSRVAPKRKLPAKNPRSMTEEEFKRYKRDKELARRSKDRQIPGLGRAAQMGLNHIMAIQHAGGGWRYDFGQPGDTSVVGWMLMALESGRMAELDVNPRTREGCNVFLNAVSGDEYGSKYHYTAARKRDTHATTSIGLLCRMYLGWERASRGMAEGARQLSEWGPSRQDMYYDYYATQVMHHYGGPLWKKWNEKMRDYLVDAQVKQRDSHELGSWSFTGGHGAGTGGRLYNTAMACMILEVYYRHMPIYGKGSNDGKKR